MDPASVNALFEGMVDDELLAMMASSTSVSQVPDDSIRRVFMRDQTRTLRVLIQRQLVTLETAKRMVATSGSVMRNVILWYQRHNCLDVLLRAFPEIVDVQTDADGKTLLHWAMRYGSGGAVRVLLKHEADTEVRDRHGKRATDMALEIYYRQMDYDNARVCIAQHGDWVHSLRGAWVISCVRGKPCWI
jgi:hypothetical protein